MKTNGAIGIKGPPLKLKISFSMSLSEKNSSLFLID